MYNNISAQIGYHQVFRQERTNGCRVRINKYNNNNNNKHNVEFTLSELMRGKSDLGI
jgi:hypothetical protein